MWHFIFRIHLAAVILGKCHINKDFVIYQRKLLRVAGLAISFFSSPPSPSFAPYSAFAGCFKSASHKKSLSQWNTAIWEIIEWWLGGTNASLRNYTTISPAFTTFLKASCHPGRKSPRLKIHYIFKPAWWHGNLIPRCNTTTHSSHSSYANAKAPASLCLSHFTFLRLFSSLFVTPKTPPKPLTLQSQNLGSVFTLRSKFGVLSNEQASLIGLFPDQYGSWLMFIHLTLVGQIWKDDVMPFRTPACFMQQSHNIAIFCFLCTYVYTHYMNISHPKSWQQHLSIKLANYLLWSVVALFLFQETRLPHRSICRNGQCGIWWDIE